MISWIQRYFQQHFRILFGLLLAVVIVTFVFTFGPSGGFGRADRPFVQREFLGYNLNDADDQRRLLGDAQLSARLQGAFGVTQEQLQEYAFQRAAALHFANEWKLPAATDAELTDAVKNLRIFQGADGQFDATAYKNFRDNLKTGAEGSTEADIKRVLSDDVRMEKVNKLLAGPGYILPADIKNQLVRSDTSWTLATATADYASFKVDVKPTDAELTKFFEENSFRYDIPPRVVVSYAEFPTTAYLDQVNVTEAEVRAFYDENPARFPKAANPVTPGPTPAPANPEADFAAVRPQVEAALKLERAQRLALRAASDFAVAVYDAKVPNGATIETFAAARKANLKQLPPFTRDAPPAELGSSPQITEEAFKLNESRFVSEPLSIPSGAAVLFWKETQPTRTPMLHEVRDRVVADYVENEKRQRFVELGKTIKAELETRLKAGDTFEKAVEAAARRADIKLDPKSTAAFTMRNPPQDLDYAVVGSLERLEQGQVSDMVLTGDKGILVHVLDKKLPQLDDSNPRFLETRNQLAAYTSRMAANAYLSDFVEKEHERTQPKP